MNDDRLEITESVRQSKWSKNGKSFVLTYDNEMGYQLFPSDGDHKSKPLSVFDPRAKDDLIVKTLKTKGYVRNFNETKIDFTKRMLQLNEALNPINEALPPKTWTPIDNYDVTKVEIDTKRDARITDNFNIYRTDKGTFVIVSVNARTKPLVTAKTLPQLLKLGRQQKYKFKKKGKDDWAGYEEPGRSRSRSNPHGYDGDW